VSKTRSPASVGVIGLGYVGLTTAVCLASKGIKTIGIDNDEKKLEGIVRSQVPFIESGMNELLPKVLKGGRLRVASAYDALVDTSIQFITVGTPSSSDGSIDLSYVHSAARSIGRTIRNSHRYKLIVVKSTVTPGTTRGVVKPALESESHKKLGEFGLASNPEFLREGRALADTLRPDRLVIGTEDTKSERFLISLFRRFYRKLPPTLFTTTVNAELIKYASNAFLATKVTFINELANLCAKLPGADVSVVARGMGLDRRIAPGFLSAGLGFGGSCVPPSEKVQATNGLKPIGEIRPGERVLAHDGRYHEVTQVYSRHFDGNLMKIHGRGLHSFPIVCTPEHPILVGRRRITGASRLYNNRGRRKLMNAAGFEEPVFLAASEVQHGDVLFLPSPIPASPQIPAVPYETVYQRKRPASVAHVAVTSELQYLFGVYLAEGSIWDENVEWVLHGRELDIVEELDTITTKHFGHRTRVRDKRGNGIHARISSKPLAIYLRSTFGTHAWGKKVPQDWVTSLPEDHLIQLLRGMMRGDGSNSGGRYDFTTTSEHLWNFVQLSLLRLRIPFSSHKNPERVGVDGVHHRESFTVRVTDTETINRVIHVAQRIERRRKKYNVSAFRGGYFAFPVSQVSQIPYSGEVRNLEVEGANSFVLQGGTVHNCLPKDVNALLRAAERAGVRLGVAEAAVGVNMKQPLVAIELAEDLVGDLRGKRVALLGLAFKPDSDDMRDAVSLRLIKELEKRKAKVVAYDPAAMPNAKKILGERIMYSNSALDCLRGADCCIIVTEWKEFSKLRPKHFEEAMRTPAVVDGRRALDPEPFVRSAVGFAAVGLFRGH